jgi:hypothetical protein
MYYDNCPHMQSYNNSTERFYIHRTPTQTLENSHTSTRIKTTIHWQTIKAEGAMCTVSVFPGLPLTVRDTAEETQCDLCSVKFYITFYMDGQMR